MFKMGFRKDLTGHERMAECCTRSIIGNMEEQGMQCVRD